MCVKLAVINLVEGRYTTAKPRMHAREYGAI